MNDQLQQALSNIIGKVSTGVDAGTQFLSDQIPDVIHQLLMWKLAFNGLGMFFSMMGIIAVYIITSKIYTSEKKEGIWYRGPEYSWENGPKFRDSTFFVLFGCGFFLVISVLVFIGSLIEAVQIWIAPKVYLIEYAASLAK